MKKILSPTKARKKKQITVDGIPVKVETGKRQITTEVKTFTITLDVDVDQIKEAILNKYPNIPKDAEIECDGVVVRWYEKP
jgi:uncharacterized OsmC-like protein